MLKNVLDEAMILYNHLSFYILIIAATLGVLCFHCIINYSIKKFCNDIRNKYIFILEILRLPIIVSAYLTGIFLFIDIGEIRLIGVLTSVLFCSHYITNYSIKKISEKIKNKQVLIYKTINILRLPIIVSIYLMGVFLFISFTEIQEINKSLSVTLHTIKTISLFLLVTWTLIRIVNTIENHYLHSEANNKFAFSLNIAGTISKILILFVVCVSALNILGVDTSAILTISGVGGIAFGFAGKDLFANFFGFLVIALDQPFKVGDVIDSPDKQIKGIVEKISWRVTRVLTFDKKPIYIPNALFTTIIVQNRSQMLARRIKEVLRFIYPDQQTLQEFIYNVIKYLNNNSDIRKDFQPTFSVIKISKDIAEIQITCFTVTTDWNKYIKIKQDIFLHIAEIAENHDLVALLQNANLQIYNKLESYTEGRK